MGAVVKAMEQPVANLHGLVSQWITVCCLAVLFTCYAVETKELVHHRVVRQSEAPGGSMLTVEWEGIHVGVRDELIKGFMVEYRAENEVVWKRYDDLIAYRGADHKYRVRIKNLPGGEIYFVRISILDMRDQVIVQTPPIKARSDESVQLSCTEGQMSEPMNVQIVSRGRSSLTFSWDPPECGTADKYLVEVVGQDSWAVFDSHREESVGTSITIQNLLPGTTYSFRVKAIGRGMESGWTEEFSKERTDSEPPKISTEIQALYRTDKEIRIEWQPYRGRRVAHYEIAISERLTDDSTVQVSQAQVSPTETHYVFTNLKPSTRYRIGVIAFDDSGPRQVYQLDSTTAPASAEIWTVMPTIMQLPQKGKFQVKWLAPTEFRDLSGFLVEYRLPNETTWRRHGSVLNYYPSQREYQTELDGITGRTIFVVRVHVLNGNQEVVAQSQEFRVGAETERSCTGPAGTPKNVNPSQVEQTSATFTWERPRCDETYGPIEGYEYKFWDTSLSPIEPEQGTHTPDTRIALTGLRQEHRYAIRVRARSRGGFSPWSDLVNVETRSSPTSQIMTRGNKPFLLRVILSAPQRFLAWRPPVPSADQGTVSHFKLKYIKAVDVAGGRWVVIEDRAESATFRCPSGVGNPGDYCYNLKDLEFGVQYNAKVSAQFHNGEWSLDESLHFILVEAIIYTGQQVPTSPIRLKCTYLSYDSCECTWFPPLTRDIPVDEYRITIRVVDTRNPSVLIGTVESLRVPHDKTTEVIDHLAENTKYNISVEAGYLGNYGPAAWQLWETGEKDIPPEIQQPRAVQEGGIITLSWDVTGNVRKLCCYEVEMQVDPTRGWVKKGTRVSQDGDKREFYTIITDVPANTELLFRVQGLLPSGTIACTSPPVRIRTQCTAPKEPPVNIQATSPDPRSLLLSWNHPDRSTWGCNEIWYNVEAYVDGRRQDLISVRPDPRGFRVEHPLRAEPGQNWRIRIQTVNSGGVSPWSAEVSGRTEAEAYASRPRLSPQGGNIRVDWTSLGQGAQKVAGYYVEYKNSRSNAWQRFGSMVSYNGDNQPYSNTITGLQIGESFDVRIQVLDRRQQVIFTSEPATTQTTCSPPTESPINLQLTAPDPRHVKLTWQEPPQETWRCNDVYYEIQVLEPYGQTNQQARRGQTQFVFDAKPNQKWTVQMRTVNSAGSSLWSRRMSIQTSVAGPLIEGLQVTYQRDVPMLTWRSIVGVDDLVQGYMVEYQCDDYPQWRELSGDMVRYVGAQRPYQVTLDRLPEGQTCLVRVKVIDNNNDVAFTSQPQEVRTKARCRPPDRAPSDIRLVPVGSTQVQVMWRPLSRTEWNCDQIFYVIKYTTDRAQGLKNVSSEETSSYFESEPYTTWRFQMQAVNQAGPGPWSQEQTVRTDAGISGPPKGLVIIPLGPDSARLTWQLPDRPNGVITGYEITYQLLNRGMCGERPEPSITVNAPDTNYILSNLSPNSRYRVTVAARTSVMGEKITQEFTTESGVPMGPPRNVRPQGVQERSATISWQPPSCIDTNGEIIQYGYEMRGLDFWATSDNRRANTPTAEVSLSGLMPYTRYEIKVQAYTSRGPGPWSETVQFTTDSSNAPPVPPNLRVVGAQPESIYLMWQSPVPPQGKIDSYKIQYAPAGTGRWTEMTFTQEQLRCSPEFVRSQRDPLPPGAELLCAEIEHLSPGQHYDFQVAGHIMGKSWGPWSNLVTAQTKDQGPVPILVVEKTGASESWIEIRWDIDRSHQHRIRGFRIIVNPISDSKRVQQFTVDPTTFNYRIPNLEPNTQYNITVQSRTDTGFHEGASNTFSTEEARLDMGTAPRIVGRTSNSVTVEWNKPTDPRGVVGFVVEFNVPPGGDWAQFGPMIPFEDRKNVYQATITQLAPNSDVIIRLKAVGRNNQMGQPSPEVPARTECAEPGLPPQNVELSSTSPNQLRLTWREPDPSTWRCDQITYEIAYFTDKQRREQIIPVSSGQTENTFLSSPHTQWTVKIRTKNRVGTSQWSRDYTHTTAQGTPGRVINLRLQPLSPNEVLASWSPPAESQGVAGYDVEYRLVRLLACPDSQPQGYIRIYNVPDSKYTLTGLLPYAEYEVRVAARTTELGPWESQTITTQQGAPTASPKNLKAQYILERSISFNWNPPECEQQHGAITSYQYEFYGLDDWAKLDVRVANISGTQIDVDGLTPYTKYRMKVKAYTSQGSGPSTSDLDIMTEKADAPLPPQDLSVVSEGLDFVILSWVSPYPPYGPMQSYQVHYRLADQSESSASQPLEVGVNDTRLRCEGVPKQVQRPRLCLRVDGLRPASQYRMKVAARIIDGSYGPWSPEAAAYTLSDVPGAPRSIRILEKTDSSLKIGWEPPADPRGSITQYKITAESVTSGKPGISKTYTVQAPLTEFMLEGLEPETQYNITVQAGTSRGFGPGTSKLESTESGAIPVVREPPTLTPRGADTIAVEFRGVSDSKYVQGYILEYRRSDEPSWQEFNGVIPHDILKPVYTEKITNLQPATLYNVRVKVVDNKNRLGQPSPQAEARTGCTAPTSPPRTIELKSPDSNQLRVTWQSPPPSTWRCSSVQYRLQYRNGTLGEWQFVDLPSSRNDYTFNSAPYTQWSIQMRTQNEAGNSEWTEPISLRTAQARPGKPRDPTGTAQGPTEINVRWLAPEQPNGDITGYVLTYRRKSKSSCPLVDAGQPVVKTVQYEQQKLDGLEPATTYEITIAARTVEDGPPSDPIFVTTEDAIPTGAPTDVDATTLQQRGATVTWKDPPCDQRNGAINRYEYTVEGVDSWAKNEKQDGSVSTPRVELAKLTPYTRYSIKVRALNSKGAGPYSAVKEFVTRPGAPPAPQDVRSDQQFPHAIQISFLEPSPPHGVLDDYRIQYTMPSRLNWVEVRRRPEELVCSGTQGTGRLCYRIPDLEAEKKYVIQVAGHTKDGDWGEWSKEIYVDTQEAQIPVLDVKPEVTDRLPNALNIMWQGVTGKDAELIDGYIVEYNRERTADWLQFGDVVKSKGTRGEVHSVQVKGLDPDTWYFVRLKVVHKNGKAGAPSPEAHAKTACGRPKSPPTDVQVKARDYQTIIVSWEPADRKTWQCERATFILRTDNGTNTAFLDFDGSSDITTQEFRSLPGTIWRVQMRTQNLDDNGDKKAQTSDWSTEVEGRVPGVPGDIGMEVKPEGPTAVSVEWSLLEKDKDYPYGVDIEYQKLQQGLCAREYFQPIKLFNQRDHRILLRDLDPFSEYSVTVKARTPEELLPRGTQGAKKTMVVRTGPALPTGPPRELRAFGITETSLAFQWDAPECQLQNGNITSYEYEFSGVDSWVTGDIRRGNTAGRTTYTFENLSPGTEYKVSVKALTDAGAGPSTRPLTVKTAGRELGAPSELHLVSATSRTLTVTWMPPQPSRGPIDEYRLLYKLNDGTKQAQIDLRPFNLSCSMVVSTHVRTGSLCYTIQGLQPETMYTIQVQAHLTSGTWGEWSHPIYAGTSNELDGNLGGSLEIVETKPESIKIKWTPPGVLSSEISHYMVGADETPGKPGPEPDKYYKVSGQMRVYQFEKLNPLTTYNVSVEGYVKGSDGKERAVFYLSRLVQTPDRVLGTINLPPPTDLELLNVTAHSMHIGWKPPELLLPGDAERIKMYKVTYAPWDPDRLESGPVQTVIVLKPHLNAKFEGLQPDTTYNITVQAGSDEGFGEALWGARSTLALGVPLVLRLIQAYPTALHVRWYHSYWGRDIPRYTLIATPIYSPDPSVDLSKEERVQVPGNLSDYVIKGLQPQTAYNVTLVPSTHTMSPVTESFNTLPPHAMVVRDLKVCDITDFAISFSWIPVDNVEATQYQVRYAHQGSVDWHLEPQRSRYEYRCPGIWNMEKCNRMCFALYNIDKPKDIKIQVRAMVSSHWNSWKTVAHPAEVDGSGTDVPCCIVPPPYFVEGRGASGTTMPITIGPVPTTNVAPVWRNIVIVDTREQLPDDEKSQFDEKLLFDRVTAERKKVPYYIAGAFDTATLDRDRTFHIGDGDIYGGYINYPLIPGKKYHWGFMTIWMEGNKTVIGWYKEAPPYRVSGYAWPWWAIALLVLLILLLLLCLFCCWRISSRYRRRRAIISSSERSPALLGVAEGEDKEKGAMAANLKALESRIDNIRTQLDSRITAHGSRDGDRDSESDSDDQRRLKRGRGRFGKGDFEDGYVRGFKDASKISSSSVARRRLDEEYGGMKADFHQGYVQGLRDAGLNSLTQSMHDLASRRTAGGGSGYSAGYMQGFRDGNSGIYGDRITASLLRRLEEQYPNQEDYRQGYLDGFKDSLQGKQTDTLQSRGSDQLTSRLTEISDRLNTLEKGKGDELHQTKIYHVYNQLPEGQDNVAYSTSAKKLASELEEFQSTSRRSTLRTHYTPGDYLKYPSDGEYGSSGMRRHRRTQSATNVGREDYGPTPRSRYDRDRELASSRVSMNTYTDTFSRRHHYRSRSDVGSYGGAPRRYGSSTILDGPRPGPMPAGGGSYRGGRDALENLQRELDNMSRSPPTDRSRPGSRPEPPRSRPPAFSPTSPASADLARGYSSDTGYMNDTWRSRGGGVSPRNVSPGDYGRKSSETRIRKQYSFAQRYQVNGQLAPPPLTDYTSRSPAESSTDGNTYKSEIHHSKTQTATKTYLTDLAGLQQHYPTSISAAGVSAASVADAPAKTSSPIPRDTAASPATSPRTETTVPISVTTGTAHDRRPANGAVSSRQQPTAQPGKSSVTGTSSSELAGTTLAEAFTLVGSCSDSSSETEMRGGPGPDGSWTDELMRIVREPMDHTLDRMKRYNTSLSHLPPSPGPASPMTVQPQDEIGARPTGSGARHTVQESYSTNYQEEMTYQPKH